MKKQHAIITSLISVCILTGCNSGSNGSIENENVANTNSTTVTQNNNSIITSKTTTQTTTSKLIKAAYVQLDASGSLSAISSNGYKAANVIIFGFADTSSSTTNSTYKTAIQNAINSESSGTVNLLSIGGQTVSSMSDTATIVSNITTQISAYNSELTGGKIDGVDLDLEGGFTAEQIKALASGFKTNGLKVSVAPQVYLSSGSEVDSSNPTNLVLTSGSPYSNQSNYTPAIAGGYVDYVMVQTYNTSGWTIKLNNNSYAENQVGFFKAVAAALNNTVKTNCSGYESNTTSICIPTSSAVVIGTVTNAGAASNSANIFGVSAGNSYDQASILASLESDIQTMQTDSSNYKYFAGVMMWSLNNDYYPSGWSDTSAGVGAFSSKIFGAELAPAATKNLQVQFTNNGQNTGVTITLIVNGLYYPFYANSGSNQSISASSYAQWCSADAASDTCPDSWNLDQITVDSTFTVQVTPDNGTAWSCSSGGKLSSGYHNIQVNNDYKSCAIS